MTNVRGRTSLKNWIIALIVLATCVLTVFPESYLVCNIALVGLSVCLYFVGTGGKLMLSDIFVLGFALLEIVVTLDVSRIAIFVFYLFVRNMAAYNRSTIKLCVILMSVFFVIVVIAYNFGFNAEYDKYSWDPSVQGMIEEKALGFTNANQCMLFLFCISCLFFLLTDKWSHYLLIFATNYVIYRYTKSRTFFYMLVVLIGLLFFFKLFRCEKRRSILGRHLSLVFPLLLVLSVGASLGFSYTRLDDLFRGRLHLNKDFLDRGITLWGVEGSIDSAYVYMLVAKGIVYTLVFAAILFFAFRKTKLNNKNAVILLSIFGVGLMEVVFFETPIMMLIGAIFGFNKEVIGNDA